MKYSFSKNAIAATLLAAGLLLGGCASMSSQVSAEGTTDKPVFPDPGKVTFDNGQGTFPNLDSLHAVKAGMTKDQLYYLLGRPHFQEGFFGVREWDYLFHFHTAANGQRKVASCQFKVLFDKHQLAQSFFMRPVGEPSEFCSLGKSRKVQQFNLDADGLFDFNKSGIQNLKQEGIQKLRHVAKVVGQASDLESIDIVGYTDPLGGVAYNQALSARRALTVKQYLASLGVPLDRMNARGAGPTSEFAQCDRRMNRASLIACLAPNRRVSLVVTQREGDTATR